MSDNQVSDISPLASFADRSPFLVLNRNSITDISIFKNFTAGLIDLHGNSASCSDLSDVRALSGATIRFDDCVSQVSLGSLTSVAGSVPSSYYDITAAADGRSAVAWQTGQPSGGASKVFLQRFDATGSPNGGIIELQDSPYGSGPVRAEWLANDSIAVTFFSYNNSRYRVELRIVDASNTIVHSGQVIGDSGRDYKPQDMVDLGDGRFVITWNMSPNHPQLPNQGAAAWVYGYDGSQIGLPFWIAESSTGSTNAGWSTSTFSAAKVDGDLVAFAVNDRSNGVDSIFTVRTFDVTAGVDTNADGYAELSPLFTQDFLGTTLDANPVSFALLEIPPGTDGTRAVMGSGSQITFGLEDNFATDNGAETLPVSSGLQAYLTGLGATRAQLDETTVNTPRAASFDLSAVSAGLTGAVLKLRAKPLDDNRAEGNDTIYLTAFDDAGTNVISAYTIGLGVDAGPNNYFDFDWQIDGRPEHPAEGYEIVIDLGNFAAQEGVDLSLLNEIQSAGKLDVVVGADTLVDYMSLELTSGAEPAYVVHLMQKRRRFRLQLWMPITTWVKNIIDRAVAWPAVSDCR